jgi:HD superfamily phosphohydrolase
VATRSKIVVDNIHGDIRLTAQEWQIVDTPSFQRLRRLKQLGMGHLTYPNATHSRFAHSLGVLHVMCRILQAPGFDLAAADQEDLRLAALLHDIGHYPYSHLMERVDNVQLTDESISPDRQMELIEVEAVEKQYPDHETLGRLILEEQDDLTKVIGSLERAQKIGQLFSRTQAANQQLSKLIHSSLDMDRLDYLIRDARAAGVAYGEIDLNYLLNSIRISPNGLVGVEQKALAAAEHFLMARMFMYRSVYYHKTTYAFEEACRQLLKRLKDAGKYDMPRSGEEIESLVSSKGFADFDDGYVDRLIQMAASDPDPVVQSLAKTIISRKVPKLIAEVSGLQDRANLHNQGAMFRQDCKHYVPALAEKFQIPLGQFLVCGPKPIKFEERSSHFDIREARDLKPEEREELIMVFWNQGIEPLSIVDVPNGLAGYCSQRVYGINRLYLIDHSADADRKLPEIRNHVRGWASEPNCPHFN